MAITPVTLTNPGAELGNVTGWTTRSGGAPGAATSGTDVPSHSGGWYFVGSGNGVTAVWDQQVDVPAGLITSVSGGHMWVRAKAWHNGFSTDTDSGALYIECYAADGVSLLARLENSQSDPTAWTQEFAAINMPAGTRKLRIGTSNKRVTGTQLSTYWDDFELEISDAPTADFGIDTSTMVPQVSKAGLIAVARPPQNTIVAKADVVAVARPPTKPLIASAGMVIVTRPKVLADSHRRRQGMLTIF